MRLFLDCEFNGFEGELISMALVADNGDEFYEVVAYEHAWCHPWVIQNVIPILNKEPISYESFQTKLSSFLRKYDSIEVIADWPEDFWHFTRALLTGPGEMMAVTKMSMTLERRLEYISSNPHNALNDAQAIKAGYFKKYEGTI